MKQHDSIVRERLRVKAEYDRRDVEIEADLYAPWQPGEILMTSERKRVAALMLQELRKFPKTGDRCLEIGYGKLGWLADILSWGINETNLYGIELDAKRADQARRILPNANLLVGDATELPWDDDHFDLAVASTVFSSILDPGVRNMIAGEMSRVVAPGGVVILYDLAVNNPRSKNLRALKRAEIRSMFADFTCYFQSVTLAPPIARPVAKINWSLAVILSGLPFLRTHFLTILIKR